MCAIIRAAAPGDYLTLRNGARVKGGCHGRSTRSSADNHGQPHFTDEMAVYRSTSLNASRGYAWYAW
jgi:hypothetical protein